MAQVLFLKSIMIVHQVVKNVVAVAFFIREHTIGKRMMEAEEELVKLLALIAMAKANKL